MTDRPSQARHCSSCSALTPLERRHVAGAYNRHRRAMRLGVEARHTAERAATGDLKPGAYAPPPKPPRCEGRQGVKPMTEAEAAEILERMGPLESAPVRPCELQALLQGDTTRTSVPARSR